MHALATVCPLLKGTMWNEHMFPVSESCSDRNMSFTQTLYLSVVRSGHSIGGDLLHHVHLLQRRHHLGSLLSLQLLPGTITLAELQQHLEHT